jgi:hypothetical protein
MTDFRGPLPLRDSDFAEVRREVLAKLERRRPIAPIVLRVALATAAAIALVFIFLPRPQPPAKLPAAVHKTVPIVAPPAPAIEVAQHPPVKPSPKPRHKAEQIVASTGGPPSDSDITMNIQTADPNVRIIWIAQR